MKLKTLLKKVPLPIYAERDPETDNLRLGSTGYAIQQDSEVIADGIQTPELAGYLCHAANVLPDLLKSVESAIEALYNVPEVGRKYDQQHSDTHLAAVVELKAALAKVENVSLRNPIARHVHRSFPVQMASTAPSLIEGTPVDHGPFGARL
jgi:hypothetical protein